MSKPTFLGPLVGRRPGKRELVHVESGAVLASRVEAALDAKARRRGLSRRGPVPKDYALIVAPCRIVHTFFSRFPIDVIFLAADGTVIKTCREVKPWRLVVARRASAAIEAAAGFIERTDTTAGDRVTIREAQLPRPARDFAPVRSGREVAPDSVGNAIRDSVPELVRDTDSDADPWGLAVPESAGVESSTPVAPAELPASPAPAVRGSRDPEPQSAALPTPAEASKGVAGPVRAARPSSAAPRSRAEVPGSVDLARILARQTPMFWFEAVAIAQELCVEVLAIGPEANPRIPELAEIAITPEGGIELRAGGPAGQAPVPRAARVLLTLLAEAQTLPVQLRLLALQEVSPAPSCRSLLEFTTRLALFERPGRRTVIQGVYKRFQALPALEAEWAEAAVSHLNAPPPPPPVWWRQRKVQAGAAAALVVVLGTAALWMWPRPARQDAGRSRGPIARAVSATADTVTQAAGNSVHAVAQWLGLAATDRPTASAPEEPAVTEVVPTGAGPRRTAAGPRAARPMEVPRAPESVSNPASEATDPAVYSAADAEVVPPVFDRSRLPTEPPAGVRLEDLPEVEVVISAAGEVESVKLVTEPVRVHAAMMLSAVKNWRFQPATRDGHAVRYRMRLRLTSQ